MARVKPGPPSLDLLGEQPPDRLLTVIQVQHTSRITLASPAQRPEPCATASLLPAGPCSREGGDGLCWPPGAVGGYHLNFGRAALLQLQLEEPPTPKLKDTEHLKRKLERDLQFGQAIRTLREGTSRLCLWGFVIRQLTRAVHGAGDLGRPLT